jgi:hypothetical protein
MPVRGAAPVGGVISVLMPPPVADQAPPPPARRASRGPIVAVVVLAMLVAALGGVVVARELNAPTDVALEPVATAGANPFMESVGTDVPDVRPVAHTSGSYSGTTPGLYGGSGDNAVCDRSRLSSFLGQHPERAAGWASVLGLRDASTSTITSYVDGLTSVVLRSDTYVTNHGWASGRVTSWPAVLQAGTAVLVDRYGNLVTRCFCGNPLTAPQSFNTVAYVGPRWSSFSSSSVTVITHQTTQVTNNFTIIDVHTGRGHDRPHGTEGEQDRPNDSVRANDPGTDPEAGQTPAGPQQPDVNAANPGTGPVVQDDTTPIAGTSPEGETSQDGVTDPGASSLSPDTTSSSTTTPPSSTTTTTSSSTSEPFGPYTASSSCTVGTGTVTFESTGSYTAGSDTGSWEMRGEDLVLTTSSGSEVEFTGSTALWSDTSGCTLSQS